MNNFTVFDLGRSPDRFSLVETIINQEIPDGPIEVKAACATYARGNPGAARLIARQARAFTTREEVESFIGWPLSGGIVEQGHEIYDRLKNKEN